MEKTTAAVVAASKAVVMAKPVRALDKAGFRAAVRNAKAYLIATKLDPVVADKAAAVEAELAAKRQTLTDAREVALATLAEAAAARPASALNKAYDLVTFIAKKK